MTNAEKQALEQWAKSTTGAVWRPARQLIVKDILKQDVEDRLNSLQQQTTVVNTVTPPTSPKPYGYVPRHVNNVLVTESPTRQQDRTFSLVSVQFTRNPKDRAYAGVKIWFTGYKGNPNPVLMADASDSPVSFLAETTGETVLVTVQAVGASGASPSFSTAPTATVVLDGVTSAPPAPSIAQLKTAIGTPTVGWQFQFHFLTNLPDDAIDGYWIYRTDTHAEPGPSARYKFVKHAVTGANLYTFQDVTGETTEYFYYVSAVNQAGNESTLVDADGSGGGSGLVTSYSPSVGSGTYTDLSKPYDNNNSTYSYGAVSSFAGLKSATWSGFSPEPGMPTAVTLKVLSRYSTAGYGEHIRLEYSKDNGGSWADIYNVLNGNRLNSAEDQVSLPAAQDLTQVKVRATATVGSGAASGASHYINEIWIETTL